MEQDNTTCSLVGQASKGLGTEWGPSGTDWGPTGVPPPAPVEGVCTHPWQEAREEELLSWMQIKCMGRGSLLLKHVM